MIKLFKSAKIFTLLLLVLSSGISFASSYKYAQIRALLKQNKPQQAYDLANDALHDAAGDIEFDLLYARAGFKPSGPRSSAITIGLTAYLFKPPKVPG